MHSSRMRTARSPSMHCAGGWGVSASGGGSAPGGGLLSRHALRQSTSFAGGNNDVIALVLHDQSKYSIPVTSDTSRIHKGFVQRLLKIPTLFFCTHPKLNVSKNVNNTSLEVYT